MTSRRFEAGDVLFRAGEPARYAYVIVDGRVALSDADGATTRFLDEPGSVIGAAALIGSANASTATALNDVYARLIDRDAFLDGLRGLGSAGEAEVGAILAHLGLFCRPADVDGGDTMNGHVTRWSSLKLTAETTLGREMPAAGIDIGAVPFSVGRRPTRGEVTPRGIVDLRLSDSRPFSLSRLHFAIERVSGSLSVRDLGSNLGTKVNGTLIGTDAPQNVAPLRAGANDIVAGGAQSPFRFTLAVATDD